MVAFFDAWGGVVSRRSRRGSGEAGCDTDGWIKESVHSLMSGK